MIEALEKESELIMSRVAHVAGRGEEATKQALVLPWLSALGWDVWNPNEVCPEFESDTAIKKSGQKEKVDLALLCGSIPSVFIEVKSLEEKLDGHHGQLKRYFNSTTSVSLGVLTNGIEYRFFTDSAESNVMDDEPFYISRLDASERGLDVVLRFSKEQFNAEAIRDYATELKFTARIERFLTDQLDLRERNPSESFIRWVLGEGIYDGRVTGNVVERFSSITKESLQRVQMRMVRRSIARMEEGVSSYEPAEKASSIEDVDCQNESVTTPGKGIVTTDSELIAYSLVRKMADEEGVSGAMIYDPGKRKDEVVEVGYRDTTGYFSVYINKTSWWCTRFNFDAKQKWVGLPFEVSSDELPEGFTLLPKNNLAATRISFEDASDLAQLKPLFLKAMKYVIDEKNAFK